MGSPVDLTLGRSSSESQTVPSRNNGYHLREVTQESLRVMKEERQKVEGFKRELPLCIQLLDDAINATEEKLVHGNEIVLPTALRLSRNLEKEKSGEALIPESRRHMLEEFLPLKKRDRDDPPSDISSDGELRTTKSNQPPWMAETRLWNPTAARSTEVMREETTRDPVQSEQEQSSVTSSQQRPSGSGAFMPFQIQPPMPVVSRPRPRSGGFCADLNLCVQGTLRAAEVEVGSAAAEAVAAAPAAVQNVQIGKDMENFSSGGGGGCGGNSSSSARKARRCWSPELHHRFVSALHQLGGSHIATPKQLRELMKVDGLTNDEVKSHLQKYRLHTRRPSSSPSPHQSAAVSAAPPQLLLVGGIWMPPQHASPAAANNSQPAGSHSGATDQAPQFCHSGSLPLDYFAACINNNDTPAAAGPAPMQMLQLHRQPMFEAPQAAGTSQSQTSPQGPLQLTSQLSGATQGSSSETYESGEEEAKSKSTSWNQLSRQREGIQNATVEASPRLEPAEPTKNEQLEVS